jgi:hypothetical protein
MFAAFTVTNMRTNEHTPKGCSCSFAVQCVEFVFGRPFLALGGVIPTVGMTAYRLDG